MTWTGTVLPAVAALRFQLEDVSLQCRHLPGLGFQLFHLIHTAENGLPGLLDLPPHVHLLPLQRLVALLQSSRRVCTSPQLLLKPLVVEHGFFCLSVSGAPQQLHLFQKVLQALQIALVARQALRSNLVLARYKATSLWMMSGVAFQESDLRNVTTGKDNKPSFLHFK